MKLSKYIDHTGLKQDLSKEQVIKLCNEAKEHEFAAVVVNSYYVGLVAQQLKGTKVKVASVVGFPLGACTTATKVFETEDAIRDGADEIDMVINIGALKDKDYDVVRNDIQSVITAARGKAIVKVIIESCLLSEDEIVKVCEICVDAGADYVKTSTGFSTGGATIEAISLMKRTIKDKANIKASGGIRTYEDAISFINAGADRIGTSNGVVIIEGNR